MKKRSTDFCSLQHFGAVSHDLQQGSVNRFVSQVGDADVCHHIHEARDTTAGAVQARQMYELLRSFFDAPATPTSGRIDSLDETVDIFVVPVRC